ncbi:MAG: MoxR family ATPase [Bryobacterales bacterium]|nr:MoxR family ATPase [Bryobacterales bacterium]
MSDSRSIPSSISELQSMLAREEYVSDRALATSLFLGLRLQRPVLLEGEAGVGKTEVAKAVAAALGRSLIRMQCYEGLDVSHAVYEWNYSRQILEIQLMRGGGELDRRAATKELFRREFLIERPILRAIEHDGPPPVLLIDELDRADQEFEGFLLEMLSDYQVTIPELGTVRASQPPIVLITSNRTRELHDALKRRCLYCWIDYPDFQKELRIVQIKVPGASRALSEQATAFVQELRTAELYKTAGVSETLDWVAALVALDEDLLTPERINETLGILLKNQEDIQAVRGEPVKAMLDRARHRGVRMSYAGQEPTTAWATSSKT